VVANLKPSDEKVIQMATNDATRIAVTPLFRMVYPKLLKPEAYKGEKGKGEKEKGDPTYQLEMLYDDADLAKFQLWDADSNAFVDKDIRLICVEMAKEAWGAEFQIKEAVTHGGMKWPIVSGAQALEKLAKKGKKADDYKHYQGAVSIIRGKASEEMAPSLLYPSDGKWVQLNRGISEDAAKIKNLFTGGAYARAEVKLKTSVVDEKKFIVFYVNTVRFEKTGPKIGGASLMDRFNGVQGGAAAHDPTSGMDDIPF